MAGFNAGANGNTQMPILYAVRGASYDNYALFLDNSYRHRWDFGAETKWRVEVSDGPLSLYLMTGKDLADLRGDYMELVGHPLVPPKKMFGLWVSEYGYDDWSELDGKLDSLLKKDFPLDGFVLDLQWFGGIQAGSDDTQSELARKHPPRLFPQWQHAAAVHDVALRGRRYSAPWCRHVVRRHRRPSRKPRRPQC
jgi:alpha-glucosidase